MSEKDRSRQRVKSFINKLNQGIASLTDEEFAMLKRMIVERRGRDEAHVAVATIDTAEPSSYRLRSSEISFDVRVRMEETTRAEDGHGARSTRTIIDWYGSARITIGWYGF